MKTIFTIILFAVAVGMVFWIARPIWDNIQSMRAEQAVVSDTLARLQDLQKLRDDLLKTYNSIPKESLARLDAFLPPRPDNGNILVMLEKMSRERGIKLRRVDFLKDFNQAIAAQAQQTAQAGATAGRIVPKIEIPYNGVSYSFSLSANYDAFRSILSALENSLRIVDVEEISFSVGSADAFEFTLKAKSYYQK